MRASKRLCLYMDGFRRRKLWLKIVFSPDLPTNARSPNDIFFELVGGRPRVVVVEVEQSVWQRCGAVSTRAFACLLVRLCWEGTREKVRGVGVRRVGGVGLRIAVQSSAIKNEVEPVMRQIFKIYENTRKYTKIHENTDSGRSAQKFICPLLAKCITSRSVQKSTQRLSSAHSTRV